MSQSGPVDTTKTCVLRHPAVNVLVYVHEHVHVSEGAGGGVGTASCVGDVHVYVHEHVHGRKVRWGAESPEVHRPLVVRADEELLNVQVERFGEL